MKSTNSNKTGDKLYYRGYNLYVIKHTKKHLIISRCNETSMLKCIGTIYTDMKKLKIIEIRKDHPLAKKSNQNEITFTKCYNDMKDRAKIIIR